jgi:hypothetical protein
MLTVWKHGDYEFDDSILIRVTDGAISLLGDLSPMMLLSRLFKADCLLSRLQGVQHCNKCAYINNIGPGFGISRFNGEAKA